jgi:hypothetical protein
LYPEIFRQGDEELGLDSASLFSKKWSRYSELYALSQGDLRRFNTITKMKVHKCFMYLAFEKEKIDLENTMIKKQLNPK